MKFSSALEPLVLRELKEGEFSLRLELTKECAINFIVHRWDRFDKPKKFFTVEYDRLGWNFADGKFNIKRTLFSTFPHEQIEQQVQKQCSTIAGPLEIHVFATELEIFFSAVVEEASEARKQSLTNAEAHAQV